MCPILIAVFISFLIASTSQAAVLVAKVQDIDGHPVEAVKIFLYQSGNVRKPADFISGPTDKQGMVSATIPAGNYWAVARLKHGSLYGPLMPGDKHSGEPVEVQVDDKAQTGLDFVVADIREVGQKKRTTNAVAVKLSGRVIDKEGKPVSDAYVFAGRTSAIEAVPEYVSAWTDQSGGYTLYLPPGHYFVGSARKFPLPGSVTGLRALDMTGKFDIATDIQLTVY